MRLFLLIALLLLSHVYDVSAECVVNTGTPTYVEGKRIDLICDANGKLQTNATGGGDGGMSETPSWSSPRRSPLFMR